jgi:hypothetical protein
MRTLQRVGYAPFKQGCGFIHDIQLQIIYATMQRIIPVYNVPGNVFALDVECTDEEREIIQNAINVHLGIILGACRSYVLCYLFENGLYVGNRPATLILAKAS